MRLRFAAAGWKRLRGVGVCGCGEGGGGRAAVLRLRGDAVVGWLRARVCGLVV